MISTITGQKTVPFGDAVIATRDTCIGSEICEELYIADNTHIHMAEDGVEIFTNGSGSHHELRKLDKRLNLIVNGTARVGLSFIICKQHTVRSTVIYMFKIWHTVLALLYCI